VIDVGAVGDRFLILADESADWQVAGLRQLDRLALALNELAQSIDRGARIDIMVFWNPKILIPARWKPPDLLHTRIRLTTQSDTLEPGARILSTHLFVGRNRLEQIIAAAPRVIDEAKIGDETELWNKLEPNVQNVLRQYCANQRDSFVCHYLVQPSEIATCERRLLREAGKSNDGIVARFLNRPISRSVSRILLKTKITPNGWSVGTMIIPFIGCLFLMRGTYWGFVLGTAFYHLHSALDGCDGEIARAKYLDSERGRRVDAFCDLGVTILLALSLGVGLYRQGAAVNSAHLVYLLEGFVSALLVSLQWWISHRSNTSFGHLSRRALGITETKSETGSVRASPRSIFAGARWLLIEATKRDVAQLFFVLLAIAGATAWILHFLFAYALFGFVLTATALSLSNSSQRPD
jgi:phosphatidylglycerophosphate synthase